MKEKGKSNPFAAFIRPTEQILWQSKQKISVQETLLPGINPIYFAAFVIFCVFAICVLFLTSKNTTLAATLSTSFTLAVVFWLRFYGKRTLRSFLNGDLTSSLPDTAFYAITSERLFFQKGDDIQALALEKISVISVLASKGTQGTLSFGAGFPMWGSLENAQNVKTIIEQAQKDRLKELKA